MSDKFDKLRESLGTDKVDTFLAAFGLGPKYKPTPTPMQYCPKCGGMNAYHKEVHQDTDINEIVLFCPDCKKETP